MIHHAQKFPRLALPSRALQRLPMESGRSQAVDSGLAPSGTTPLNAEGAGGKGSQRAQLIAAAASLVWFAGWFQAIYDEIAGNERGE